MKIFTVLFYVFLVCCFISSIFMFVAGIVTTPDEIIAEEGMDVVMNMSETEIGEDGFIMSGYYYIDELEVLECYATVRAYETYDSDGYGSTEFYVNETNGRVVDEHYAVKFYDSTGKAYVAPMVVERYDVANELIDVENDKLPVKIQAYVERGWDYDPVYRGKLSVYEYEKESLEKFAEQEDAVRVIGDLYYFAGTQSDFESERDGFAKTERVMYFGCSALFMLPVALFVISLVRKIRKKRKANME